MARACSSVSVCAETVSGIVTTVAATRHWVSFFIASSLVRHRAPTRLLARGVSRKARPEHRSFALGLFLGGLVLEHVPVFSKDPVFDAQDVGSNPIHERTTTAESPV